MAVGDIVSQVGATSTNFTFRPASGVQVCITQFLTTAQYNDEIYGRGNINSSQFFRMTAGGSTSGDSHVSNWANASHKFFIDYNSYLYFVRYSSLQIGFTGIQTQ
tara:strand:+ start:1071 stop:1385 length:315 start_codon:yes stop_codon:yes gene_type:complete